MSKGKNFEYDIIGRLQGHTYKSPQEVVDDGVRAELLLHSPIFRVAIEEMYNNLTTQEDILIGSSHADNRDVNANIRKLGTMRCLLSDFIMTLDAYIKRAEELQQ